MRILGFMTGTSLDAVDMAVLETDGEDIQAFGPSGERKLREETRDLLLVATEIARAWPRDKPAPDIFDRGPRAVADEHFHAAESFHGRAWPVLVEFDLLGVHGQTVLHERPEPGRIGRTVQLLDAERLAKASGRPVAFDFRTADVASGGQGAPLAPIYHAARARASGLAAPVAALNIGGVANITLIDAEGDHLLAFDTGPGNGMIDLMLQSRGLGRFDDERPAGRRGQGYDQGVLDTFLAGAYFAGPAPKSLDRYDFPLDAGRAPVRRGRRRHPGGLHRRGRRQGVRARARCRRPDRLRRRRHNPQIMRVLAERAPVPGQDRRGLWLARRRHRGRGLRLSGGADGERVADQLSGDDGRGGADDGRRIVQPT
jgi:anhydro-N-acetylmuramic acid kinase